MHRIFDLDILQANASVVYVLSLDGNLKCVIWSLLTIVTSAGSSILDASVYINLDLLYCLQILKKIDDIFFQIF